MFNCDIDDLRGSTRDSTGVQNAMMDKRSRTGIWLGLFFLVLVRVGLADLLYLVAL
jgi:hypothetical protein